MKLTWDEFYGICQSHKPSQFSPPDWEKIEEAVAAYLAVQQSPALHSKILELKSRYSKYRSNQQKRKSHERDAPCTDVVLESDEYEPLESVSDVPKKKTRKSLGDLGERQLKNRTEELWLKVVDYAAENDETPLRILALLLKKCNDKGARDFGESIWNQKTSSSSSTSSTLNLDTAMAIMVDCKLGRETYSKLRKTLKQQGHNILPPWNHLRSEQASISPKSKPLPDPHKGVHLPYSESMQITAKRIMETLPKQLVPSSAVMNIKFGFDGSGSHALYRQLENTKTNNIIMSMFCPLSINSDNGEVKWTQKSPNSALTHRPLALQLGKESTETLKSLQVFDDEIKAMETEGFTTVVDETPVFVKVNVASHMMDLKAANLYLSLLGAFCDLCDHSREDCHNPDLVRQGFEITRTVSNLHSIFEDIVDQDGEIVKHRNDYDSRKGLTAKPIANHEVVSVQVLHALLRTFDHFMKIAVHLRAEFLEWTESDSSIYHQFLVAAKKEIQTKLDEVIGEKWDFPDKAGKGGTSTTGNTARRILHHGGRDIVIQMIPDRFRGIMTQIGQYLSVILRLFSSSERINIEEYKKVCTSLYLMYLESFPAKQKKKSQNVLDLVWVRITPTLHKLLAHSWELIDMNEGCGLKNWDESGLEANNKVLRAIRLKLARKTSQADNLEDVINRMWLGSDPKINHIRLQAQSFCKHCKEHGHSTRYCKTAHPVFGPLTDDDALFEKLCI